MGPCLQPRRSPAAAFAVVVSLLFALLASPSCHADSHTERIAWLLERQSQSPDGFIHLNDASFEHFVHYTEMRLYSLIAFFDAQQLHEDSEARLGDIRREFGLLASTYIRHNKGTAAASQVFFVDMEFTESMKTFAHYGVNALPHIRHIPEGSFMDGEVMKPSDFLGHAEGMAAFVESKTKQKVGTVERPTPVTETQLVILVGGLLAVAPFILKKVIAGNTILHNPMLWASLAILAYFFSVSGGMHNIIRSTPLFTVDRDNPGKLTFFLQTSGMQVGAEGFIVGLLYMVFGLSLAYVTHFLPKVKNHSAQRIVMVVCMVIGVWVVKQVIFLDKWKSGYTIHSYWPNRR